MMFFKPLMSTETTDFVQINNKWLIRIKNCVVYLSSVYFHRYCCNYSLFCCMFFFGRSGFAVGLSALSFSAFASASVSSFRLQKDAASIPNALGKL